MKSFSLVVAATPEGGIGIEGRLPWRLKGDMAFFKQLTSQPADQNAVLMGRKTWQSIPVAYRPLPQRVNVILTRDPTFLHGSENENVRVATSIEAALAQLDSITGQVFVIGGAHVYKETMQSPQCERIYFTRVTSSTDTPISCDTFIPPIPLGLFRQLSLQEVEALVPWACPLNRQENGYAYEFQVYERTRHPEEGIR